MLTLKIMLPIFPERARHAPLQHNQGRMESFQYKEGIQAMGGVLVSATWHPAQISNQICYCMKQLRRARNKRQEIAPEGDICTSHTSLQLSAGLAPNSFIAQASLCLLGCSALSLGCRCLSCLLLARWRVARRLRCRILSRSGLAGFLRRGVPLRPQSAYR